MPRKTDYAKNTVKLKKSFTEERTIYQQRLKELRKSVDFDMQALSEDLMSVVDLKESTLQSWLRPKGIAYPPVEALAIIASHFHTTIGYLFGFHNVPDLQTSRKQVTISYDLCESLCYQKYGAGIVSCGFCTQTWINNLRKESQMPHRITPILSLAYGLDAPVDYLLGLTDNRYIEYDLIDAHKFNHLPDRMCVILQGLDDAYGVLSDDKQHIYIASEDESIPVWTLPDYDPIVCDITMKERRPTTSSHIRATET